MTRQGRPPVERVNVECAGCGTTVEIRATDYARRRSGRVFCSKECRDRVGSKPRRGTESPCGTCGVAVYSTPATPRRFCSKACHDAAQRKPMSTVVCGGCGTEFAGKPSAKRRYCSKACEANGRIARALDRMHNGRPVRLNTSGYVLVWEPDHPAAYGAGWIFEHRLVAEQALGRRLGPDDEVHHINRDKADNRVENLAVLSGADHGQITALDNWRDLRELKAKLARYRELYGELPEE